jgi:hypothetical protein
VGSSHVRRAFGLVLDLSSRASDQFALAARAAGSVAVRRSLTSTDRLRCTPSGQFDEETPSVPTALGASDSRRDPSSKPYPVAVRSLTFAVVPLGVRMSFPLPTRPRAARHLAMRVSRSARFTRSAGVSSRIRRRARLRSERLPSFIGPAERFSRQCISALTRPGFATKIPPPFHSRAFFRTHDPVEEPYASRELARSVLKGSLSKASSERSYRHVVSTSAAHLHSFFKDEHPRLAGDRFRPGLAPISPRWSRSVHGEPPRERRAGYSNTRALSSLAPGLRPNLSTSRRAPGRSACRLPSQRRLARSPRAPVSSRGVPNQDAFGR